MNNILFAFCLTVFAGLSTGIGGAIAILSKKNSPRFLSFSLGLSAGVMIYISMIEIFPEASFLLSNVYGNKKGYLFTTLAFFGGMGIMALIDMLVPSSDNPHEMKNPDKFDDNGKRNFYRLGLFSVIAIVIHNFPEGIAAFISATRSATIGISIAVAIAIHNIPEGIAVSVPIYYATGDKLRAFKWSLISGLSEPLGAVIAYLILMPYINDTIFGIIFAMVAGIMVYISLDELLPSAEKYGKHHTAILGLIVGMAIMALSLILFN